VRTRTELVVEGMDCPSCVNKIEGVVCRLPGVENVRLNYTSQKLSFDAGADSAAAATAAVERLGYRVRSLSDAPRSGPGWWRSGKGRLVILSGVMLALAFALSVLLPGYAGYVFSAVALIALAPLARKAWAGARAGQPFTIETLVSIAVIGAIVIDESAEAAVVVFFFLVGELLEMIAAARARRSVQALADLVPRSALLVEGQAVREVPADSLRPGDLIELRPGGRVPADGVIVQGETSVDESAVTGESVPRRKVAGDSLFAGSINAEGVIRLRVEKAAGDNMIARILKLVEEAEAARAPTERFIDAFSRYYTPGVIAVSALIAVLPPLLGGASWESWVYKGLAILLIGCPCALVLSTPAAITSGISSGARQGLLVKGGAVLEAIGRVHRIAFDKTGTLTRGRPEVTDLRPLSGVDEEELLRLAGAAEAGSSHPLAQAIVALAAVRGVDLPAAEGARALNGRGVRAVVEGREVVVASPRHAGTLVALPPDVRSGIAALEAEGKTVAVVLADARLAGLVALRDELRPDAPAAIAALRKMGISAVMLTGDNARTGRALARALGMEVEAELLPEQKLQAIARLRGNGTIAMVGDGINDAPALAAADVGIAMGGGTDVALETADAALLHERVGDVPALVALSRTTMRNIRQNITIALGLKVVFLITTLLGVTSLWMAILADTGATVLVTMNALRLLRFEHPGLERPAPA